MGCEYLDHEGNTDYMAFKLNMDGSAGKEARGGEMSLRMPYLYQQAG
jgi:hypothetical protein